MVRVRIGITRVFGNVAFFFFFFFKHLHFQINVGPRTSFLKAIQMRVDGCDIEKMPQNRSCSKSNKTQDFLQK